MANLRTDLEHLASSFVSSVLAAMQGAPLSELADESAQLPAPATATPRGRGRARSVRAAVPPVVAARPKVPSDRRHRASADEVAQQKELALSTAKQLKPGFSKGDVMSRSGSDLDLGRALSLLVADGKLIKKGDRRMTRYWLK